MVTSGLMVAVTGGAGLTVQSAVREDLRRGVYPPERIFEPREFLRELGKKILV